MRIHRHADLTARQSLRLPRQARINWPVVWVMLADVVVLAGIGTVIWLMLR